MIPRKQLRQSLVVSLLLGLGCSSPKPIEGVVRPAPGEPFLESIPGPMPGFGSFDSPSDALLAACPLILSKPNATAGRIEDQNFQLRWRTSSEYCAWIYYTPEHKYEMSLLTDQHRADDLDGRRSCLLPLYVDDKRYPPGSLKYIIAIHNHPYDGTLSKEDIRFIVSGAVEHGFESTTKDGSSKLSTVAFFSNSFADPSCDGFHQYIPATGQILTWTKTAGRWDCTQTGLVTWPTDTDTISITKTNTSCVGESAP